MFTSTFLTALTSLTALYTPILGHPQSSLDSQDVQARQDNSSQQLVQPVYQSLPLGSIKPRGWLRDQLIQEAEGQAGNLYDFYRFVHDSNWVGGSSEYSDLHESAPYWFNGLVSLAYGLDDQRLQGQVNDFADIILGNQQEDGWIGPETTPETRGLWARCYILLGLMQLAEADPSQTDRIVDAMHRYIELAHSMLQDGFQGLIEKEGDIFDSDGFGAARAHEMHIPLQWLYENHPKDNADLIWETMELMIDGATKFGVDWRDWFVEGVYPPVTYHPREESYTWLFTHGVNHAEGLRFPLSIYRMSHDEALKTQTRTAVDLLARYHKSLSGTIIGDEYITDLNPSRGAELCTHSEMMFSTAYIYQYLADNDLADWTELTAFNAFPGSISPDWWSHQYVQQENQPWSRNLTEHPQMWQNVGSRGNIFGLEPNYPCCTVNHPQAYPKFLANSFVVTEDGGIAHVLLSPGSVSTTLGDDNKVTIEADTNYPFALSLRYTITADSDFTFYVRVPDWATESSTSSGPDSDASAAIQPSDRRLQSFAIKGGQDSSVTVQFGAEPRFVTRANNTAAVYYGPLLYSLALDFEWQDVDPVSFDGEALDSSTTTARTRDHVLETDTHWNIAIDPTKIRVHAADDAATQQLQSPIWDLNAPPVELRVAAVEIDWPVLFDTPSNPPSEAAVLEGAQPFAARFVPFGSAKLHMAHFPVVELADVDLDV